LLRVSQLGLKFAAFFEKLTIMMDDFAKHLVYLSKYAETFLEYPDVQNVRYRSCAISTSVANYTIQALSSAYQYLLEFCAAARKVFVDDCGETRRECLHFSFCVLSG
jgi:hypothetical protein